MLSLYMTKPHISSKYHDFTHSFLAFKRNILFLCKTRVGKLFDCWSTMILKFDQGAGTEVL